MKVHDQIYIDGAWVKPSGTAVFDVINATTEEVMGKIPGGNAEDADRAVRAARRAFPSWSALSVEERAKYLDRLQTALLDRVDEIAGLVSREVGMPLKMADGAGRLPGDAELGFFAKVARATSGKKSWQSVVVREPIGVVGCITPWNSR